MGLVLPTYPTFYKSLPVGSGSGATNLSYFLREFVCRLWVWCYQPVILSTRVCVSALGLVLPTCHTFYESLCVGSGSGATNLSYFLREFVCRLWVWCYQPVILSTRVCVSALGLVLPTCHTFYESLPVGSGSGATNLSYFLREFACRLWVWCYQPVILSTRVCVSALGLVPLTCHTFYESLPVGSGSGATNLSYFLREFACLLWVWCYQPIIISTRVCLSAVCLVLPTYHTVYESLPVGSGSGATNLSYFLREFACRLWVWCYQPVILSTRVCLSALGLVLPTCHTFYESLCVGSGSGATNLSYFLREFACRLWVWCYQPIILSTRVCLSSLGLVLPTYHTFYESLPVGCVSGATNLSYCLREFACRLWVWCCQPIILSTRVCLSAVGLVPPKCHTFHESLPVGCDQDLTGAFD